MLEIVLILSAAAGVMGTTGLMAFSARGFVELVDDGGVRWSIGSTRSYLPFAAIESASVDRNISGEARLVLRLREGRPRVRKLRGRQAVATLLEEVLHGLSRAPRSSEGAPAIDVRLAAIDARHVVGEGGYRGAALDAVGLRETFGDRAASSAERAVAGYELLRYGAEDDVAAVTAAITPSLPPVVVATLMKTASPPAKLRRLAIEAAPYLTDAEREALARHPNA